MVVRVVIVDDGIGLPTNVGSSHQAPRQRRPARERAMRQPSSSTSSASPASVAPPTARAHPSSTPVPSLRVDPTHMSLAATNSQPLSVTRDDARMHECADGGDLHRRSRSSSPTATPESLTSAWLPDVEADNSRPASAEPPTEVEQVREASPSAHASHGGHALVSTHGEVRTSASPLGDPVSVPAAPVPLHVKQCASARNANQADRTVAGVAERVHEHVPPPRNRTGPQSLSVRLRSVLGLRPRLRSARVEPLSDIDSDHIAGATHDGTQVLPMELREAPPTAHRRLRRWKFGPAFRTWRTSPAPASGVRAIPTVGDHDARHQSWSSDTSSTPLLADSHVSLPPWVVSRRSHTLNVFSSSSTGPGAGVGLTMCAQVASSMGGRVAVRDRGRGGRALQRWLQQLETNLSLGLAGESAATSPVASAGSRPQLAPAAHLRDTLPGASSHTTAPQPAASLLPPAARRTLVDQTHGAVFVFDLPVLVPPPGVDWAADADDGEQPIEADVATTEARAAQRRRRAHSHSYDGASDGAQSEAAWAATGTQGRTWESLHMRGRPAAAQMRRGGADDARSELSARDMSTPLPDGVGPSPQSMASAHVQPPAGARYPHPSRASWLREWAQVRVAENEAAMQADLLLNAPHAYSGAHHHGSLHSTTHSALSLRRHEGQATQLAPKRPEHRTTDTDDPAAIESDETHTGSSDVSNNVGVRGAGIGAPSRLADEPGWVVPLVPRGVNSPRASTAEAGGTSEPPAPENVAASSTTSHTPATATVTCGSPEGRAGDCRDARQRSREQRIASPTQSQPPPLSHAAEARQHVVSARAHGFGTGVGGEDQANIATTSTTPLPLLRLSSTASVVSVHSFASPTAPESAGHVVERAALVESLHPKSLISHGSVTREAQRRLQALSAGSDSEHPRRIPASAIPAQKAFWQTPRPEPPPSPLAPMQLQLSAASEEHQPDAAPAIATHSATSHQQYQQSQRGSLRLGPLRVPAIPGHAPPGERASDAASAGHAVLVAAAQIAPLVSRVLVVDDDSLNARLLARMLRSCGVPHVHTADDGTSALRAWRRALTDSSPYTCLFTDIVMVRMHGDALLQQLQRDREESVHIGAHEHAASVSKEVVDAGVSSPTFVRPATTMPVLAIACTANARHEDVAAYLQQGFLRVLCKPFSKEQVAQALLLVQQHLSESR